MYIGICMYICINKQYIENSGYMEEETTTYKSIGFLYARRAKKQFRVSFLAMPTTSGSLKEITDDIQSAYLELEDCQLIGIAQRTCGDMQLCKESEEMFLHFVNTITENGVFLICKVNGFSVLDPSEKWTALYSVVDGKPQQVTMNYIAKRGVAEENSFQILTTRKLGKSDEEDVRKSIREALLKQAMGIQSGNDNNIENIIIVDDLGVPLGDPISYHPDDEMCYEIRVPPDGSCFLHADQVRLDPIDWLNAKRSQDGFANDHERVKLECALAAKKREGLLDAFANNCSVRQVNDLLENRYQVEKEDVDTIAKKWLVNIRITLSPAMRKLASEDDWDCLYQLDNCDKDDELHVLLSLLDSGSGHYTALLRNLPAGCVYEAGCVKLVRIPAKPRTTQRIHGTLFDILPSNDSFAKTTPLHDNEGYIENSITELSVEQTQPRYVDDTGERKQMQLVAGDFLESDSSDVSSEIMFAGDLSETDFNDGCFQEVTPVKINKTDDKSWSSPSCHSPGSCCSTVLFWKRGGMETSVGKPRSSSSTPRPSVCGSELKTQDIFEPIWDSDSPVHSDNDQSHMRNTDLQSPMHIDDELHFGTTPEAYRDSDSPVQSDNDQSHMRNTDLKSPMLTDDDFNLYSPESDQDCNATEDIYS